MKASFTVRWGVYRPFLEASVAGGEDFIGSFHAILRGTKPDEGSYPFGSYNLERKMAGHLCPNGTFCFQDDTKCGIQFVLTGKVTVGKNISLVS